MTASAPCEVPGCVKNSTRVIGNVWICDDHEIKFEKENPVDLKKTESAIARLKGMATTRAKIQEGYRLKIDLDGTQEFNEIIPFSMNRICKNLEESGNVPEGLAYRLRRFGKVVVEYPSGQKRTFSIEKV
jgi:hypothetical protein